jgi:hypothetical protein
MSFKKEEPSACLALGELVPYENFRWTILGIALKKSIGGSYRLFFKPIDSDVIFNGCF